MANEAFTESTRLLSFSLGEEDFAIPLLKVKEVIGIPDITPVPHTPAHFLGIMNLRGQVISVIDLRTKFGMKKVQATTESAIIIVDLNPVYLGVVVDSVNSVLNLKGDEVSPPPEIESKTRADYIMGVVKSDKRLTLLIDIGRALDVEDLSAIRRQGGPQQAAA